MKNQIPVKKNENYIVEVTDQSHEGHGVAKIDGFTVFVEFALPGEKVEIKIVKIMSSHAYGKLIKILEPSLIRVEPSCEVYKRCGGCQLQHMSYDAQLKFKTGRVKNAIQRIGGLEDVNVLDTIGMREPKNYRNKSQYPLGMENGQVIMGFYANRSHEIISGSNCLIQHPEGIRLAEIVREFINEKKIPVYDEKTGKGIVRHVVTRIGVNTGESMVVIVANTEKLPCSSELVEYLRQEKPEITSVVLNINKKKTNVILGEKNILLYGRNCIIDSIGKYRFKISPHSFFQVNPVQTEVLYKKAIEYASLKGNEVVFDLYCGIGTISMFLSEKAGKVYGVEFVEPAVKDAVENAKLNGIDNVEFICGEAEKVVPEMGVKADVVVLDPPRKGCERALLDAVVEMQPEKIVYVSCNPATLARDLKVLAEAGYRAKEVQPVDMFCQSFHVETCSLLVRERT